MTAAIERWAADPVAFVMEVFGPGYEEATGEPLEIDRWQRRMLRYCVKHEPHGTCDGTRHKRIAAKACKGPGKTCVLAWIGLWFIECFQHPKAAAASITGDNLSDGLWTEFATWIRYSPLLKAQFNLRAETIESKDHPDTWWLSARTFKQDANADEQSASMAGLHARCMLVLLDEVGSYPHGVVAAAGAIHNDGKAEITLEVVVGNPTDVDGPLHKICTEDADQWAIVEITGDPDDPERSTRVSLEEANAAIKKHGRNDPIVMVNYLGQFPPKGGSKLLSANEVRLAMQRDCPRSLFQQEAMVWGLDVAGEGLDPDEATLYKRQGQVAFRPSAWRNMKTLELAERVVFEYQEARKVGKHPKKLFVDKGGVGRGCWEYLERLLPNGVVVGVDFGQNALDESQYEDRRTEMWCLMAEWTRTVGCLPEVPELRRDLTAPNLGVESNKTAGTRRKLESKKQMKARGVSSPDHGDGLALTFAAPVLPDQFDEIAAGINSTAATDFDPYQHMTG